MPTKHNKKRYQAKAKPKKTLVLTGTVYLMFRDDGQYETMAKSGDLLVYPSCEPLHTVRQGEYDATGFVGYFKVDICDGRQWLPVLLNDIFDGREHHFSKYDCPSDVYALCEERLQSLTGRALERTYREHYSLVEAD